MLVTTITIISFKVPDECDKAREFELSNDVRFWEKSETSEYIIYKTTAYSATSYKE